MLQPPEDLIEVGQLRAAYGIQGWLWVYSHTDPMQNLFNYLPWWVHTAAGWQTIDVKRWRTQGKGLVVLLKDIADRNDAEKLTGMKIWMSKAQLPKAGLDEFYWADLVGLTVLGTDDTGQQVNLGKISELFETGANDVMVVRATAESIDGEERMIPWHNDVVIHIDLEQKTIQVNWGADY